MKEYSMRNFLEILTMVVLLNAVFFIVTAVLHELGHVTLGLFKGCENIRIVFFNFETFSTYTMMDCPANFAVNSGLYIFLSSFIFVLPLASILLLVRDFGESYLSLVILGGNIMGSAFDLMLFYPSMILQYLVILLGALLIILGEDRLIKYLVNKRTASINNKFYIKENEKSK